MTGQTSSRPRFAKASTPAIVFGSLALALALTTLQDTEAQAQKGESRAPGGRETIGCKIAWRCDSSIAAKVAVT